MSDVKAIAAVCEMCGGRLVIKDNDNFECEYDGLIYPKEWVKARIQEITGTVRIEGSVQIEGMPSAAQLSANAETFIKLQKYSEALKHFQKLQTDYPDDYRGWWGAVRVLSHELTSFSLSKADYANIISDGKSAIKISDKELSVELQRKLDKYVVKVYQTMTTRHKDELQNKNELIEGSLVLKRTLQADTERVYLESKKLYEKAMREHSYAENKHMKAWASSKKICTILNVLFGIWVLYLLIVLIMDFSFLALLGIVFILICLPAIVIGWVEDGVRSHADKIANEASNKRTALSAKENEYSQADSLFRKVCNDVDKLDEYIKNNENILSELSKGQSAKFHEDYISGVLNVMGTVQY